MKKRLLVMLCLIAVLIAAISVNAYVAESCPCGGAAEGKGAHTCAAVTWENWTAGDSLPNTPGNYRLTQTVNLSAQVTLAAGTYNLDLNGQTVNVNCDRGIYMNTNGTNLNIYDTAGGGQMIHTNTVPPVIGGLIQMENDKADMLLNIFGGTYSYAADGAAVSYGLISVGKSATACLYHGTVTGGKGAEYAGNIHVGGIFKQYGGVVSKGQTTAKSGGNISVESTGTYELYGGSITDGKASSFGGNLFVSGSFTMSDGTISGGYAGRGGNVYVGGSFAMSGGTISGGSVASRGGNVHVQGSFTMNGGTLSGGSAPGHYGGSVYVAGTFDMNNGTVDGGYSPKNGGNIALEGSTAVMNMRGGTVRNGRTGDSGGNIFEVSGATLNLYGGTITGGMRLKDGVESAQESGNIFVNNSNMHLYGGTIDGDVVDVVKSTITLQGNPVINMGQKAGLSFWTSTVMTCSNLTGQPNTICISTSAGRAFASGVAADKTQVFYSNKGLFPVNTDGSVSMETTPPARTGCVCGGKLTESEYHIHQNVTWEPWTDTTKLPTIAGYYYLVNDVQTSGATINGTEDVTLGLDLNGKTVTGPDKSSRIYSLFGENQKIHLILTDSVGTGKVQLGAATDTDEGQIVWLRKAHQLDIYGGSYDGTGHVSKNPGAMFNAYAGTINVYGGTFQNGESTANGAIFCMYGDGVVMNMYGGLIKNGYSTVNGGNVFIRSKAVLNMYGGTIQDGRTGDSGGNIFVYDNGVLNLHGGTITGGMKLVDGTETAAESGNIFINNAAMNLYGGTIDGDVVDVVKSAITVQGAPVINKGNKAGLTLWSAAGKLSCSNLTGDAGSICVSTATGRVFADGVSEDQLDIFFSDKGYEALLVNDAVQMETAGSRSGCVCGGAWEHTHTDIIWKPWTSAEKLPTTAGNYYLTQNVELAATVKYPAGEFNLDLNGKTVNVNCDRGLYVYIADTTLNICDSVGGAQMIHTGQTAPAIGGLITMENNRTNMVLNIYGGTYTSAQDVAVTYGLVYVGQGAAANLYSGAVTGATGTTYPCNVFIRGTFTQYGGSITNGISPTGNGANVFVDSMGLFELYGGTVSDGQASNTDTAKFTSGGNVAVMGTMNMYDGTIENGTAGRFGGNVYVGGSFTMTGGQILGGTSGEFAGSVFVKTTGNVAIGGTAQIDGELYIAEAAQTALSGSIVLEYMVINGSTANIQVGALTEQASVTHVGAGYNGFFGVLSITDEAQIAQSVAAIHPDEEDAHWVLVNTEDGLRWGFALVEGGYAVYLRRGSSFVKAYTTLAAAFAELKEGEWLQLQKTVTEDVTVRWDLYLDLAGNSINGTVTVVEGATLYGMDSSTNDYDCSDGYGKIKTVVGQLAAHHQTDINGNVRRYLTVTEADGVSFHRIYVGIKAMSLKPDADAIGYKAEFYGDEIVMDVLANGGTFGFKIWIEGYEHCAVTRFMDGAYFLSGADGNILTLRIKNIDVANFGQVNICAEPFIIANGQNITGSTASCSMYSMLQRINADLTPYTQTQIQAVQKLIARYEDIMGAWGLDKLYVKEEQ